MKDIDTIVPLKCHQPDAMLPAEANPGGPSKGDLESMAKRRYQEPEPFLSGHWWYLLYWQDSFTNGMLVRKRKRHKLGPATLPYRVAKKLAAEFLRPMNQQLEPISAASKFEDFVKIYRKDVMPAM